MNPTPLSNLLGQVMAASIRSWVRMTGRPVLQAEAEWLDSPMGRSQEIGSEFYADLAKAKQLKISRDGEAGLLRSLDELKGQDFDPTAIHPRIRDFYEHTAAYGMEAWSEVGLATRIFLWALTRFVSRPMNQLNFPVSSLELSGGMSSEVLPMIDENGRRVYTGWLRRLPALDRVIYTGLYSVERPARSPDPCVKVSFPLPHGSSTVFLRPHAAEEGSLQLISSGKGFGDAGFYRMLELGDGQWRVRYIKTLREFFHVYVDAADRLRCDHTVRFLGLQVLHLHYRMDRIKRDVQRGA